MALVATLPDFAYQSVSGVLVPPFIMPPVFMVSLLSVFQFRTCKKFTYGSKSDNRPDDSGVP